MFDVQATRPAYARMNSVVGQRNMLFYITSGAVHTTAFMYLSFFFRFRRITALPALAIGTAYFSFFQNVNNILYKLIVDKKVIEEARKLGYEAQIQPVGNRMIRGMNYKWGITNLRWIAANLLAIQLFKQIVD